MYTKEQLHEIGIKQWVDIAKQFSESSILLGNGFSINFSETLRYKNLYDHFIKDCSPKVKILFDSFDTRNFEDILESLEITETVCDSIALQKGNLSDFQNEVREGLIKSIQSIHPNHRHVDYDKVSKVAAQFKSFNQIFTTNYDLFLYYVILELQNFGDHLFNFLEPGFHYFGDADVQKSNHIYYLHGALFLSEASLHTLKLISPRNGWLLDAITNEIKKHNYPLFISEGKSESKEKAIRANRYLSFCFERFSKYSEQCSDKTLIVYGQSLNKQDSHIVKAIDKRFEKVAISIRPEDWSTIGALKAEKNRIASLFEDTEYEFYDSNSLFEF